MKLGELTLKLPQANERLQSARFDGVRGYAVTFRQTDPLFTLDLNDPANPQQVGELQMPGYLHYMEPRGERMIALGLDSSNPDGGVKPTCPRRGRGAPPLAPAQACDHR